MVRLLERARAQRQDAELFAGLVHACRYCGLFEASLAAHEEARRLDPHVPTSLAYTLFLAGDYERLFRTADTILDIEPRALGYFALGRREEARQLLQGLTGAHLPRIFRLAAEGLQAALDDRKDEIETVEAAIRAHTDPEALYMFATFLAALGRPDRALEVLRGVVGRGFAVAPALKRDPLLASVREDPAFAALVLDAEGARQEAHAAFARAGGRELLGV
jgi:tetratricopeptide (TPR) repeat protein